MAAVDAAGEVSPALAAENAAAGAGVGVCSGWMPAFVRARGRRVCLLTAAVIVASIADLVLTLTLLLNWGLSEGNPLARAVMSYQSPGMVVAWRLLTLALGVMILVRLRKSPIAEIGAWLCFAAMVWLSFQWAGYVAELEHITATASTSQEVATDDTWVSFVPATLGP